MTGGRLARVAEYLMNEEAFCFTYGDGVSNVNISKLIQFHKKHGKDATLTAVYPPGRFGALDIVDDQIKLFTEKPKGDGSLINGGFFVLSPKVIDFIDDDTNEIWEKKPLEDLASAKELAAFKHEGFWQPMDTLRDKKFLEDLWNNNNAPWKIW